MNVQNSEHIDVAIEVFRLKTKDDDIWLKLPPDRSPAQERLPHVIAAHAEIHHFRAYTPLLEGELQVSVIRPNLVIVNIVPRGKGIPKCGNAQGVGVSGSLLYSRCDRMPAATVDRERALMPQRIRTIGPSRLLVVQNSRCIHVMEVSVDPLFETIYRQCVWLERVAQEGELTVGVD